MDISHAGHDGAERWRVEHCAKEAVPVPPPDSHVSQSRAWPSTGHHKPEPVQNHCLPGACKIGVSTKEQCRSQEGRDTQLEGDSCVLDPKSAIHVGTLGKKDSHISHSEASQGFGRPWPLLNPDRSPAS